MACELAGLPREQIDRQFAFREFSRSGRGVAHILRRLALEDTKRRLKDGLLKDFTHLVSLLYRPGIASERLPHRLECGPQLTKRRATMESVAQRILGRPVITFAGTEERGFSLLENLQAKFPELHGWFGPKPSLPSAVPGVIIPGMQPPLTIGSVTGRRLAICVGVDRYPTAPLGGCVMTRDSGTTPCATSDLRAYTGGSERSRPAARLLRDPACRVCRRRTPTDMDPVGETLKKSSTFA